MAGPKNMHSSSGCAVTNRTLPERSNCLRPLDFRRNTDSNIDKVKVLKSITVSHRSSKFKTATYAVEEAAIFVRQRGFPLEHPLSASQLQHSATDR